jgi:hypothetical protein
LSFGSGAEQRLGTKKHGPGRSWVLQAMVIHDLVTPRPTRPMAPTNKIRLPIALILSCFHGDVANSHARLPDHAPSGTAMQTCARMLQYFFGRSAFYASAASIDNYVLQRPAPWTLEISTTGNVAPGLGRACLLRTAAG